MGKSLYTRHSLTASASVEASKDEPSGSASRNIATTEIAVAAKIVDRQHSVGSMHASQS
jgi:hypothetical protein